MSTPAQKANLARIRDNQRRSRARKREYVQELEQRLRTCELQGIEASAEVQMAARRVAEENRILKEILHKNGVADEYITHCIQSAMHGQGSELNPSASAPFAAGNPQAGASMQSLQQVLVPRRPHTLDPSAPFLPAQTSREASIASGSTTVSSMWGDSAQGLQPGYLQQSPVNVAPATIPSTGSHGYTGQIYPTDTPPRTGSFSSGQQQPPQRPPQPQQQQQQQQQPQGQMSFLGQQHVPSNFPSQQMGYTIPNTSFQANPRDYGQSGGYS